MREYFSVLKTTCCSACHFDYDLSKKVAEGRAVTYAQSTASAFPLDLLTLDECNIHGAQATVEKQAKEIGQSALYLQSN